jgi:hypothetical protein
MSVPIEEVPLWGILSGIGHAIQLAKGGWSLTACEMFSPSLALTHDKPTRICGKCRARLRTANVINLRGQP